MENLNQFGVRDSKFKCTSLLAPDFTGNAPVKRTSITVTTDITKDLHCIIL